MEPLVIITTSGTGQRLSKYTRYTNKSLVPLGDKFAICRIIDMYPETTRFIITLGHWGKLVKDFLTLAYPEKLFQFVQVHPFEGAGSSLGCSLLHAMPFAQCPFVFHCCDAILPHEKEWFTSGVNSVLVHPSGSTTKYASIVCDQDRVLSMQEKGAPTADYFYTGVSHIHDYHGFWKALTTLYENNPEFSELSDIHAIQKMLPSSPFRFSVAKEWFDTGNPVSFETASQHYQSGLTILPKPYESLCFFPDFVIKFIHDPHINAKRVQRANVLAPFTPIIMEHRDNFIKMERVDGVILSEVKQYGHVGKLLEWSIHHLWVGLVIDEAFRGSCRHFYIDKTLSRLQPDRFPRETFVINGIHVPPVQELLETASNELSTNSFCRIHGDFILENIFWTKQNNYCLIDWRHEFDKDQVEKGDMYYDLSKLRHNIILNHKNVLQDLYVVENTKTNEWVVDLKCNYFHVQQLEDFEEFVRLYELDLSRIKVITAVIWLNMAPLYEGRFSTFLYFFGLYNLSLALRL